MGEWDRFFPVRIQLLVQNLQKAEQSFVKSLMDLNTCKEQLEKLLENLKKLKENYLQTNVRRQQLEKTTQLSTSFDDIFLLERTI